jgi:hypothetical protein
LRDELPELITNTDFDVAIAYALKLSGCSFYPRPAHIFVSKQASKPKRLDQVEESVDGRMDGWMKKSTGSQQQAPWGIDRSMDQVVERESLDGWMESHHTADGC